MSDVPQVVLEVLQLTASDNIARNSAAVGTLLLGGSGYFAYSLINRSPKQITLWHKVLIFLLLISGLLFTAAAPTAALWTKYTESSKKAQLCELAPDPARSFQNLLTNSRVDWLLRLVIYNKKRPDLTIGKLQSLGPEGQDLTFVADYEELRGVNVAEAARRMGRTLETGEGVSMVIFPRMGRKIIPVNALGLLQAVYQIQSKNQPSTNALDITNQLHDTAALAGLKLEEQKDPDEKLPLDTWAWKTYEQFYEQYCDLSLEFRCKKPPYAAKDKLGGINRDWHPLGFSCKKPMIPDPCAEGARNTFCKIQNPENPVAVWDTLKDYYGVRVFFIENLPIQELEGRILIDFPDPDQENIPAVIARPDSLGSNQD